MENESNNKWKLLAFDSVLEKTSLIAKKISCHVLAEFYLKFLVFLIINIVLSTLGVLRHMNVLLICFILYSILLTQLRADHQLKSK